MTSVTSIFFGSKSPSLSRIGRREPPRHHIDDGNLDICSSVENADCCLCIADRRAVVPQSLSVEQCAGAPQSSRSDAPWDTIAHELTVEQCAELVWTHQQMFFAGVEVTVCLYVPHPLPTLSMESISLSLPSLDPAMMPLALFRTSKEQGS
eukprot:1574262-Rhodomonas_salina.1